MPGYIENTDKIKEAYKAAFGDLLPDWNEDREKLDAIENNLVALDKEMKVAEQNIEREEWKNKLTGGKKWA